MEYPQLRELTDSEIETRANFEGNDFVLLLERIQNPRIKTQMLDLLCNSETLALKSLESSGFTISSTRHENPEMMYYQGKYYENNKPVGTLLRAYPKNFPRTRDEIAIWLEERIAFVSSHTSIDLSSKQPDEHCIPLNWVVPNSGQKLTTKQMSVVEAHEKGHNLRKYSDLGAYFAPGFNFSKVEVTEQDIEMHMQADKIEGDSPRSHEKIIADMASYVSSPEEIAERMSQLKNYFGMTGEDIFTKKHLDYAREHYVSDTGVDNRMTHFFQAITPETENQFLELINSSGI